MPFPINIENGDMIAIENVKFSIRNLFKTRVGGRLLNPTFGTRATVFQSQDILNICIEDILQQENRIAGRNAVVVDENASLEFDIQPLH